ncbi:hypothetical protein TSUD_33250 [Trifolium subterraneum]|uniref:Uncharacterized protein n=1 Tax=Trifolium subterraneum TaxID=3900 RepID=A0A2Z6LUR9_TRISU|nr:hypothetical protein TSUD_33250 [Trifolium subterraneum]
MVVEQGKRLGLMGDGDDDDDGGGGVFREYDQVAENQYKKNMVVGQGKELGLMGDDDGVCGVHCEDGLNEEI